MRLISYSQILILILLISSCHAESWTVNENDSIQRILSQAAPGDVIIINKGIFHENLVINKSLKLIGNETPVIDGMGQGNVITLKADGISLLGFSLSNSSFMPGNDSGIKIASAYNEIKNNTIIKCATGVSLDNSLNNSIEENHIMNCSMGISLRNGTGNSIGKNSIKGSEEGIFLRESTNNTLRKNILTTNKYGLLLQHCQGNYILENNISYNDHGIVLDGCTGNILKMNNMSRNRWNFASNGKNDIDASNVAEGKAIYYLYGVSNQTVIAPSITAATVYCFNCNNITIKNQTMANNNYGIYLFNTTNSLIENITLKNNINDIVLDDSSFNKIISNNMGQNENNSITLIKSDYNLLNKNNISNGARGFYIFRSDQNEINNNTMEGNRRGSIVRESRENVIKDNAFNLTVSEEDDGMLLEKSDNNTLKENNFYRNNRHGINLDNSHNNQIERNKADYNKISGMNILESSYNRIFGNRVSFSIEESGFKIYDSNSNTIKYNDASYNMLNGLIFDNSHNNTIEGNLADGNNQNGLDISYSNGNRIENNTASNNTDGFYLYSCNNYLLSGNSATNNSANGFHISGNTNADYTNNTARNDARIGFLFDDCQFGSILFNKGNENLIGLVLYQSSDYIIANNDFSYNMANGLSLEDWSENITVINNSAKANEGFAIALLNSVNNTIRDNDISENLAGLGFFKSSNSTVYDNNYKNNKVAIYLNQSLLEPTSDVLSGRSLISMPIGTKANIYLLGSNNQSNTSEENISKFLRSYEILAEMPKLGRESIVVSDSGTSASTSVSEPSSSGGSGESSTGISILAIYNLKVNEIKKSLTRGKLVHSNYTEMNVSQVYLFEARIAANETEKNIRADFSSMPSETKDLLVSEYMEVNLTGADFEIAPQSKLIQPIPKWGMGKDFIQWLWNVKPLKEGTHNLVLTARAVIAADKENLPESTCFLDTKTVKINVIVEKKPVPPPLSKEGLTEAGKIWDTIYAKISALIILLISIFSLREKITDWRKQNKSK